MFPWGEPGPLAEAAGPRPWQTAILDDIGQHLRGENWSTPLKIAVASGHGIGKSALVGMILNWGLSTCPDSKIIVTAGTGQQLSTRTVPEVTKWFRRAFTGEWFDVNATSIRYRDPKRQATWRCDFNTWSEHNTDAFAGVHNQGRRIVLVFDEASAIADKVWEVAEGALTDEKTEIIWLVFGNPTQPDGAFFECFNKQKHRWRTYQIDSREVDGTNKAEISKWIEDYGEDSDWVRVRVRGVFPRAGSNQFIGQDLVDAARRYSAEGFGHLPKIGACDVARFGDDQTVIGDRQGRKARIWHKFRGLDTIQVAKHCIEYIDEESPDAFVVDGDGLGAGVVDYLRERNYHRKTAVIEFHGGASPDDANAYFNRRAECWGLMRDWLKSGAEIPKDNELESDLTGPTYGFSPKQQLQLEKKEDMKKEGKASPDCADMLAMTFGVKIIPTPKPAPRPYISHDQGWMG